MSDIHISLKPETVATIGDFPVTNSLWVSIGISFFLIVAFAVIAKRMKNVPGKIQLLTEIFIGGSYGFVNGVTNNEKTTRRIFPLFATLALFFLFSNLLGFIPGLTAVMVGDAPLYRAPTTDYALVFALTMVSFILFQAVAVATGGLAGYGKQFFDVDNTPLPIAILMGPLNIVGELAKIVSLSFRLFGNIFAGEVLATVTLSLAPYIAPIPFAMLGLLSSVIQAFVFPILVLIFLNMAIITREETTASDSKRPADAS